MGRGTGTRNSDPPGSLSRARSENGKVAGTRERDREETDRAQERSFAASSRFARADASRLADHEALFLALEERGQSVSWPKEEEGALTLGVDGETVRFCVLEITESVRHVLTPAEQKRPWTAPKWDYKLTGK